MNGIVPGIISEPIPELKNLTSEEKLELATELWQELESNPEALPVRVDHLAIIRERIAHYRKHPEDTESWEDVKRRVLRSR